MPNEKPGPYVWADEMAKVVFINDQEHKLYIAFDIHHKGENRFHHITESWELFGDLSTLKDNSLNVARYGPYLIVMNTLESYVNKKQPITKSFNFSKDIYDAVNMFNNKNYNTDKPLVVKPGETFIFKIKGW